MRIDEKFEKTYGSLPVKALQIGEGNFLRAFADYIIETANSCGVFNGSILQCQPIERGLAEVINSQNGMYTVIMRGMENGETVERFERITCVKGCINPFENPQALLDAARLDTLEIIISNTTEAGIAYVEGDSPAAFPAVSYPAKLTVLLHERFTHFGAAQDKGLLILPVELIERNGDNLRHCVLRYAREWALGEDFVAWLETACCFANTLVDRIVTGYPADEAAELCARFGYEDRLLDTCEPFLCWVIECDARFKSKFPVEDIGLDIIFTNDMNPYRTRKVRILNGAHTVSVLSAYHSGFDTVREMMDDSTYNKLINSVLFDEIIPTLSLPREELELFAAAVLDRFSNPFIKHRLLDISLNSVSKFKARCLDSLLGYYSLKNELPKILVFGLAALIYFYRGEFEGEKYFGLRGTEKYEIRDSADVLRFMHFAWQSSSPAGAVLSNTAFWGRDLKELDGLESAVEELLAAFEKNGMAAAAKEVVS